MEGIPGEEALGSEAPYVCSGVQHSARTMSHIPALVGPWPKAVQFGLDRTLARQILHQVLPPDIQRNPNASAGRMLAAARRRPPTDPAYMAAPLLAAAFWRAVRVFV
jgi:hypothetical protein